ncbi:unnamed protein product [Ambrosiozyma monospora]|uniref:Unnamed protein product n=1 Tax=Ambrosiozyma monospora TaxID=43982 RepID=A0ACB5UBF7_AMBMO|nr:unnamed protein product [Ambrosiozyma monospora]
MNMLLPWLTTYGTFRNVSFKDAFLSQIHQDTDIQEFAAATVDNTDQFFRCSSSRRLSKKSNSKATPSANQPTTLDPVDPSTILPSQVEQIHNNNISITGEPAPPVDNSLPHALIQFDNLPQESFNALLDTSLSACLIGEAVSLIQITRSVSSVPLTTLVTNTCSQLSLTLLF